MRDEYDFSKAKKNPYVKKLKERTTIRLDKTAKDYFQKLANKNGIPYQSLINFYLMDCAEKKLDLTIKWKKSS
jgi:predicted DNA binding CopG/RHH family protein